MFALQTPTPVDKLPIIAVIGRPNTGKSTIVNKLTISFKVILEIERIEWDLGVSTIFRSWTLEG